MNKYIFLTFIFFVSPKVFSQIKEVDYKPFTRAFKADTTDEKCKRLFEKAQDDFQSAQYVLQLSKPASYGTTQLKVLKEEFNVEATYPKFYLDDCYNYYLKVFLNERHGFDVLAYSKAKADSLDAAGLGYKMEKFLYEGGLNKYFISQLTKKELHYLKDKYGSLTLFYEFEIDENGVCSVLNIDKNIITPVIEPLFHKYIDDKKLFSPRIIEGKPTKTWQGTEINFSEY